MNLSRRPILVTAAALSAAVFQFRGSLRSVRGLLCVGWNCRRVSRSAARQVGCVHLVICAAERLAGVTITANRFGNAVSGIHLPGRVLEDQDSGRSQPNKVEEWTAAAGGERE